ncbi:hypothetical protein KDL01_12520 [Actinospica durhamensis]|uniref:Uncharacterized protein n=1 Tax=Actinospica durhamensis TaxID=1508375 RepID=A0A941EKE8_9ACTN|nr:CATRA conflict system CASPASE/TPR repeat-associated protein [Actinospica durhamensis]MBR7834095.1 hypothetical protein [Actinospica durhamensis]
MPLAECELAVHLVAIADGPGGTTGTVRAYGYLLEVWSRCRTRLGMTEPFPDSTAPPEPAPDRAGRSGLLAAAQRPGAGVFQVILRCEDGLLTLSAILSPAGGSAQDQAQEPTREPAQAAAERTQETQAPATDWAELEARWDEVAGEPPAELIGDFRLLLAKDARPSLRSAFPRLGPEAAHWDQGTKTRDGIVLGEVSARDDARIARRIVLLAKPGRDAELSAWAWSRGDLAATPFARYLQHTARLRYELRVWADGAHPRRLRQDVDSAVDALIALLPTGAVDADDPDGGGILSSTGRITALLAAETGVVVTVTRMCEMLRTVEIIHGNMAAVLGRQVAADDTQTLFADDRGLAVWLEHRLADDIAYLNAARERARDVTSFADQVVRRIAGERESAARSRQERLTVLQTAITGSILMALTAIQALGYHPAVRAQAAPALTALLSSLTLALSTRVFGVLLIGRSRVLSWLDVSAWGAAAAAASWLALSLVGNVRLGSLSPTGTTGAVSGAAFALAVTAYFVMTKIRRR